MAILSPSTLGAIREFAASRQSAVNYRKAEIDAALQAIETRLTSGATRTALSGDIEAVAPGVFSANQKDTLLVLWCRLNVTRGGMI